jgi:hypothetical protein
MARIPSMMGVMREMLVRHRGCDYTKEVWVLTTRQTGADDGELHDSSHSQVGDRLISKTEMLMPGVPLRYIMPQETDWTKYTRWRAEPAGPNSTYVPLHAVLISDARQFITAKQHENISLHALVQGIAINGITWLAIPGSSRPNPQEAAKRRKLTEDLMTWIFEGYLIPLLRVRLTLTMELMSEYILRN